MTAVLPLNEHYYIYTTVTSTMVGGKPSSAQGKPQPAAGFILLLYRAIFVFKISLLHSLISSIFLSSLLKDLMSQWNMSYILSFYKIDWIVLFCRYRSEIRWRWEAHPCGRVENFMHNCTNFTTFTTTTTWKPSKPVTRPISSAETTKVG